MKSWFIFALGLAIVAAAPRHKREERCEMVDVQPCYEYLESLADEYLERNCHQLDLGFECLRTKIRECVNAKKDVLHLQSLMVEVKDAIDRECGEKKKKRDDDDSDDSDEIVYDSIDILLPEPEGINNPLHHNYQLDPGFAPRPTILVPRYRDRGGSEAITPSILLSSYDKRKKREEDDSNDSDEVVYDSIDVLLPEPEGINDPFHPNFRLDAGFAPRTTILVPRYRDRDGIETILPSTLLPPDDKRKKREDNNESDEVVYDSIDVLLPEPEGINDPLHPNFRLDPGFAPRPTILVPRYRDRDGTETILPSTLLPSDDKRKKREDDDSNNFDEIDYVRDDVLLLDPEQIYDPLHSNFQFDSGFWPRPTFDIALISNGLNDYPDYQFDPGVAPRPRIFDPDYDYIRSESSVPLPDYNYGSHEDRFYPREYLTEHMSFEDKK